MSAVILELGDQWASQRRRWSAALVPADLPPLAVQALEQSSDHRKVNQVLPHWPQWPASEERDLCWTELEAFNNLPRDPLFEVAAWLGFPELFFIPGVAF